MIESLVVTVGVMSAGGVGSLAWWTSTRHHDKRALALADRVVGCHHRGPKASVRVIEGEIVSEGPGSPMATGGTQATGNGKACHGHLLLHEDGRTECHGGLDTCWGTGPHHTPPESCRTQSHGCGVCQSVPGGVS